MNRGFAFAMSPASKAPSSLLSSIGTFCCGLTFWIKYTSNAWPNFGRYVAAQYWLFSSSNQWSRENASVADDFTSTRVVAVVGPVTSRSDGPLVTLVAAQ